MKPTLRIQLSVMMFLNYFIWGLWFVTIFTYMTKNLGFSDADAGFAFSTYAIAAMISPFFTGMIADRFFSTERILGVLHILGAVLMYGVSQATEYGTFFTLLLGYNLVFMPSINLTNSLSFHHIDNQEKDFPTIRVLGTIGWIVAGYVISYMDAEQTSAAMQVAAICSIFMGIYCFTLPHTPPQSQRPKSRYCRNSGAGCPGSNERQIFRYRAYFFLPDLYSPCFLLFPHQCLSGRIKCRKQCTASDLGAGIRNCLSALNAIFVYSYGLEKCHADRNGRLGIEIYSLCYG